MKKVTGPSSCHYYQALNKEDYYAKEQSAKGQWLGSGASVLELTGAIEPNDDRLKRLFAGLHPTDPDTVLRQGGTTERTRKDGAVLKPVSAYDITCSAPKSVSVYWALSDEPTRAKVEAAHRSAVAKVGGYLEQQECMTRRGRGGGDGNEPVKPVMAVFQHGTSRENDPQLHSHLVLINAGIRSDGRGASLDGSRFMGKGKEALVHKLGGIYRDALRENLERDLVLETKTKPLKHGTSFELTCVPEDVCKAFSTRRSQIEAVLKPNDTSKQVQLKVLSTRKAKDTSTPEHRLFAAWKERAKALGFELKHGARRTPHHKHSQGGATPGQEVAKAVSAPEFDYDRKVSVIKQELEESCPEVERYLLFKTARARQEAVDRAFAKTKEQAERRAKRFERLTTFRYATWQMSHKTYRRLRRPQPTTERGIRAAYMVGRITKKQRDRLLYVNKHRTKEDWLESRPQTRLGINFAYATHRISNRERLVLLSHYGHLKKELLEERLPLFPSVPYISRDSRRPLSPMFLGPQEFHDEWRKEQFEERMRKAKAPEQNQKLTHTRERKRSR